MGDETDKPCSVLASSSSLNSSSTLASSASLQKTGNAVVQEFKPSKLFYLTFASLAIITLNAAFSSTSISVAIPTIAEDLQLSDLQAFWLGTSAALTSAVLQPAYGSLSQIWGRKSMILAAVVCAAAGSLCAALAENFRVMLVGRCLQGFGSGGIITLTEIIVTDLVPLRLRGQWFALIGVVWALGTVGGPVLGGVLAANVSWRWIFWINLCICGTGFFMLVVCLHLNFRCDDPMKRLKRVDWIGLFLFAPSCTAFLLSITQGGVVYPWSHWQVIVPMTLGITGTIAFILYERYLAPDPLLRLEIFNNRTANITYLSAMLHGAILWCLLYYLPSYYETVQGMTAEAASLAIFPQTLTIAPASMLVGICITRYGRYRWAIWTGWVLTTLGIGLLYLLDVGTSRAVWIAITMVGGVGTGMLFTAMANVNQASASEHHQASAVSMFAFFRTFGTALGIAIGGAVVQNQIESRVRALPAISIASSGDTASAAAGLLRLLTGMSKQTTEYDVILHVYADSLKTVWLVMTGFAGAALVASLFVEAYSLDVALAPMQGGGSDSDVREKLVVPRDEEAQIGNREPLGGDDRVSEDASRSGGDSEPSVRSSSVYSERTAVEDGMVQDRIPRLLEVDLGFDFWYEQR